MVVDRELDADALAEALAGDEDGRRLLALDVLQECDRRGPLPPIVLAPLLECLASRRKAVQRTAAEVLALWSRITPEIPGRLRARLAEGELHARFGAAFALAKIGPEPASADVLLEALGDPDGDVRWAAEAIVVGLGRRDPRLRGRLAALVSESPPLRRKMALYALRDLGGGSPALRDAMIGTLVHPDPEVRLAALSALAGLFPGDERIAAPILDLVRNDAEPRVRRAAASTLGKLELGDARGEIDAALDEAATSDDPSLRRAAIGARQKRGEPR